MPYKMLAIAGAAGVGGAALILAALLIAIKITGYSVITSI